jgi:tetratricopeptide (TPR) repeat protein
MLAVADRLAGDNEAARELFERALKVRRQTLSPNHPDHVYTLFPYGEFLLAIEEFDGAEELFETALRITEKSLGPDHPETASSHGHLGLLEWRRGNHEDAFAAFELAMPVFRERLPPRHHAIAMNNLLLAACAAHLGRNEIAIARLRDMAAVGKLTLEALELPDFDPLHGDLDFKALVEDVRSDQ